LLKNDKPLSDSCPFKHFQSEAELKLDTDTNLRYLKEK